MKQIKIKIIKLKHNPTFDDNISVKSNSKPIHNPQQQNIKINTKKIIIIFFEDEIPCVGFETSVLDIFKNSDEFIVII